MGQGGAHEARSALDRVLLAAVERGLEGPVPGQRARGEGLGVGEGDPRPPVQVHQFVRGGQVQGIEPLVGPDSSQERPSSKMSAIKASQPPTEPDKYAHHGPVRPSRQCPVDNSLPREINAVWSSQRPPRAVTAGIDREEPP